MADIKVLRLSRSYEPSINITLENGCLCFYDDGEFLDLVCKPHLAEYVVVDVHKAEIDETDPMCTVFSCDEEQEHYRFIFEFLLNAEHTIVCKPAYEEIAAKRFEDIFEFFKDKGGVC